MEVGDAGCPALCVFCKGRVPAGRRCLRLGTTLCAKRCFTLCIAVDGVPAGGSHNKAVLFAHFFKNFQKQITAFIVVEPRLSLIATAGNEVQIFSAVVTPQTLGHEGRLTLLRPEKM